MPTELNVESVGPRYDEAGALDCLEVRATFEHPAHGTRPVKAVLRGDDLTAFESAPSEGAKNAVLIRVLRPQLAREKAKHDARSARPKRPEFTPRKVTA